MPKLLTLSTDNVCTAENQQETRKVDNFYVSGFCAGEMSCSVIKQTRPYGSGFSYSPDLTISNEDLFLLGKLNTILCNGRGVISAIHGGYNLSFRGKKKVAIALLFFSRYPIITGDIANTKLSLLTKAVEILSSKGNSTRRHVDEVCLIEEIRTRLRLLKQNGLSATTIYAHEKIFSEEEIGYFLSGVFDAEGSIGLKKRRDTYQPYFTVAMKDRRIIELFQQYLRDGYVYEREHEQLFQFETGKRSNVLRLIQMFSETFPSRLQKNCLKMYRLNRILNDYTRNGKELPLYINDNNILW